MALIPKLEKICVWFLHNKSYRISVRGDGISTSYWTAATVRSNHTQHRNIRTLSMSL